MGKHTLNEQNSLTMYQKICEIIKNWILCGEGLTIVQKAVCLLEIIKFWESLQMSTKQILIKKKFNEKLTEL